MQILGSLREPDDSAAALVDLFQHLLDRGLLGQATQFTGEVLLERLPAPLGATLKRRMHIIGNVADEHIHAYKMLAAIAADHACPAEVLLTALSWPNTDGHERGETPAKRGTHARPASAKLRVSRRRRA